MPSQLHTRQTQQRRPNQNGDDIRLRDDDLGTQHMSDNDIFMPGHNNSSGSHSIDSDLDNADEPGGPEDAIQTNSGEDDIEDDNEGEHTPNMPQPSDNGTMPRAKLADLALAQSMIENIKNARLTDDIQDNDILASMYHPPTETTPPDALSILSLRIFLALIGGSQQMYNDVRDALLLHDPALQLTSYYSTRKIAQNTTGITQIRTDMCPKSCVAYTGPFSALTHCPTCGLARYEEKQSSRSSKMFRTPRQQFYTIPLGPQLQALWRTPEGADRMRYRNRKTFEVTQQLRRSGRVLAYDDVFDGQEYLSAYFSGKIKDDDVAIMFSVDGAQLYRDKQSDCWFAIWVILNLSPQLRYKKKYVLPACFVPGPDKPNNMESFLLPGFRHVSALQKDGLKVWDGRRKEIIESHPFFAFGTADTVALPVLSGLVGHNGKNGCRVYCGMPGRHKPNHPTYYPAALKPHNYQVARCDHPDVDLRKLQSPDAATYMRNLHLVLQSTTEKQYKAGRLETGIVRPSICLGFQDSLMVPVPQCFSLDLMHLVSLNIPQHLLSVWRNKGDSKITIDNGPKPDFIVLDDDTIWEQHGATVASTRSFLPESFDHPPRNPAKKINSGYKATEFLLYFWALGPGLFRPILPLHLWVHFCKLVRGIRLLHQHHITREDINNAHNMLIEWEYEFELKYYNRDLRRLHLVRPSLHSITHAAQETIRCGPLNLLAQWSLENTIGNLGREVHQHSNPFSNLAERGLLRAHTNALKAIIPQLDRPDALPRGAIPLGKGYILLTARERNDYMVTDQRETQAFHQFLSTCGDITTDIASLSIRRWARLRLPNGQLARSAWKENENRATRNTRNVKVCCILQIDCFNRLLQYSFNGKNHFAEVQYYFRVKFNDSRLKQTFAMVSEYGQPNETLLHQSHGTLHVAQYNGRNSLKVISIWSIRSVVAMVPFVLSAQESEDIDFRDRFSRSFFVAEKPFLDFTGSTGKLQTEMKQTKLHDVRETEYNSLNNEDDIGYNEEDDIQELSDEDEDGIEGYGGDLESVESEEDE